MSNPQEETVGWVQPTIEGHEYIWWVSLCYTPLQLQNATDLVFHRLRIGPFEGPANGKPPALPEVTDFYFLFLLLFSSTD